MKQKQYENVDIKKIFLTPPKVLHERIILLVTLCITFIIFFRPIQFSEIRPFEALLISGLAAVSTSWGWVVLLRSLFKKGEYKK
ncbi:hypothetical protein [Tissierella sp. Yu-01]|uniref:hypothetical protein n=1 Tax=Tissierella sp. Yu-01 TaxID=3035694 RepID=UPI00240D3C66|nr:hypothetical protein [Tissierella sp. Yu-01]WFA08585.1 hypothetical protein P3962_12775 [Tissierella sp. Yu-01]